MKRPAILVVDDDQDYALSLGELIAMQGCDVVHAFNAEEALAQYARQAFDIVFMDRKMPGMDGISCAVELRAQYPDARVILVTGHYEESELGKVTNCGLSGVIEKPVDINQLYEVIETLKRAPYILIAEDDSVCAFEVSRMLTSRGYRVGKVSDGRRAVDAVRQDAVELMILDMYMPVMNGRDVYEALRKTDSLPPTIITTACPDSELLQTEEITAGQGLDCLIKPVGTQQLYKAVDKLLAGAERA